MKKRYIKPFIDVIVVCAECEGDLLPDSYRVYNEGGELVGSGTIEEDKMPGDAEDEDRNAKYNLWDFD